MSASSNFQNTYYKRTAATAKSCFICYRPTTTVLATINTVDFFYVCDGHLKDPGFGSKVSPPSGGEDKPKMSDEEIKKVKEEWEEKQRLKEKAKSEEKNKDKDKDTDKDKVDSKETIPKPKSTPPGPKPMPVVSAPPKPTHERYVLHRDIWAMRLSEHKKKRQTAVAKQVAPKFPIAPRTAIAPSSPPPPPPSYPSAPPPPPLYPSAPPPPPFPSHPSAPLFPSYPPVPPSSYPPAPDSPPHPSAPDPPYPSAPNP